MMKINVETQTDYDTVIPQMFPCWEKKSLPINILPREGGQKFIPMEFDVRVKKGYRLGWIQDHCRNYNRFWSEYNRERNGWSKTRNTVLEVEPVLYQEGSRNRASEPAPGNSIINDESYCACHLVVDKDREKIPVWVYWCGSKKYTMAKYPMVIDMDRFHSLISSYPCARERWVFILS